MTFMGFGAGKRYSRHIPVCRERDSSWRMYTGFECWSTGTNTDRDGAIRGRTWRIHIGRKSSGRGMHCMFRWVVIQVRLWWRRNVRLDCRRCGTGMVRERVIRVRLWLLISTWSSTRSLMKSMIQNENVCSVASVDVLLSMPGCGCQLRQDETEAGV